MPTIQQVTLDLARSYKMENIEIITITYSLTNETSEHVIIDRGNGEFTSMLKSVYDEQQKAAELGGTI